MVMPLAETEVMLPLPNVTLCVAVFPVDGLFSIPND